MQKILFSFLIFSLLFTPFLSFAQELPEDEIFEAKVLQVIQEKETTHEDGSTIKQQNLKLKGLSGSYKDKEIIYRGISELEVVSSSAYKYGDKVLVTRSVGIDGDDIFYVTDYVRRTSIYILVALFALIIVIIGRSKGLRALLSLIASFAIIMFFIVPRILDGNNPLLVGIVGSFFILLFIIYLTEGFNRKSHFAILAITISLAITFLLSWLFTSFTRLTGLAQEEIMYLIGLGKGAINFQSLLLTAIIIGTLGVLDDVVISQVETVAQLKKANAKLSKKEILKRALKVGNTHMGAVVNTLFLAYAGAALPLLLLFSLNEPPVMTFTQVINQEMIATEIVRTLVGSIGIALAMPLTTFLATWYYTPKPEAARQKAETEKKLTSE